MIGLKKVSEITYTMSQKIATFLFFLITLSKINWF